VARASRNSPLLGLCVVLSAACATSPRPVETLDAVLWMQTSVEYASVTVEGFRSATRQLEPALGDTSWTAVVERPHGTGALPPAVILDVDETVLDNSAYAARRLRAGRRYSAESWAAWVEEASAPAVPGAVDFLRAARARGVTVFFVTNRDSALEEATRRNLRRIGFPPDTTEDVVLMRGERPGWGSDKTSRREHVAREHRVLLLLGDDMNDFVPARKSLAERRELWQRHAERWGRTWFALPNPTYGSWESAVTGDARDLSERELLSRKIGQLDPGT
jgi:5'-nucleotidase (lipoprotein e(P4) family)